MDGLLVVDKPAGPTSHDVVARVRRVTGERRVGHAGTLDPLASGILVLLLGRATRLARFYAASAKTYVAGISLTGATDTYDAEGTPVGTSTTVPPPDTLSLVEALGRFRGTFTQVPPPYSAKKVGGMKAYDLARRARPVALAPVTVTVHELTLLGRDGDRADVRIVCSAGFYVRALAHELGQAVGCGAHLIALRRTASGGVGLDLAVSLADIEATPANVCEHVLPVSRMLDWLPAAVVAPEAVPWLAHGRAVPPASVLRWLGDPPATTGPVRLLAPRGDLLAVADEGRGDRPLQPTVVLG